MRLYPPLGANGYLSKVMIGKLRAFTVSGERRDLTWLRWSLGTHPQALGSVESRFFR